LHHDEIAWDHAEAADVIGEIHDERWLRFHAPVLIPFGSAIGGDAASARKGRVRRVPSPSPGQCPGLGNLMAPKPTFEGPSAALNLYEAGVATNPEVDRKGAKTPCTSRNGHMFSFLDPTG
jgi:hypothetical protein